MESLNREVLYPVSSPVPCITPDTENSFTEYQILGHMRTDSMNSNTVLNAENSIELKDLVITPLTTKLTTSFFEPDTWQSPSESDDSTSRRSSISGSNIYLVAKPPPILPEKQPLHSAVRKLLSINVMFTAVIVVALIIAVGAVTTSSLVSGTNIVSGLGSTLRDSLSNQVLSSIGHMYNVTQRNMEVTRVVFELNYNYLQDLWTNPDTYNGVVNQFRSVLGNDLYAFDIALLMQDSSSIEMMLDQGLYTLTTSQAPAFNATVLVFNSSLEVLPFEVLPNIPNDRINNDTKSFWALANSYQGAGKNYYISGVMTMAPNTNAIEFMRNLHYSNGTRYAVLAFAYNQSMIQDRLTSAQATDTNSQITIVQSNGRFIASTVTPLPVFYNPNLSRETQYFSLSQTNNSELQALEAAVLAQGGWVALFNQTQFYYTSPNYGFVQVSKRVFSFPNQDWYILVAWPESYWTQRINNNTYANIGVAIFVIIVSVIVTLCFSIPVARSIRQIKECFNHIRAMELDSPVINKTVKSKFLWYETSELQSSFRAMLSTLRSFQKYVPAYVVERLVNRGQEASLGLQPESCTVFFLDIKDFTKHSEELQPRTLVKLMGEAFEGLSNIIDNHGGIIDKYIGDCIMAFWSIENHEERAVSCAVECDKYMKSMAEKWKGRNLPALECRIGINSGAVLMGNFGSSHRFNFTVIGDHVNLASRVESLNKQYDSVVLITNNTYRKLPTNKFLTRRIERVQVKGREKSVLIFQVMKLRSQATMDDISNVEIYEYGFELYVAGKFKEAKQVFKSILGYETDPVILKKIIQCDEVRRQPWTGIIKMNAK